PAYLLFEAANSGVVRFAVQRTFHNVELSIPTIYNFGLLAVNFGLLATLAAKAWMRAESTKLHWAALALIFLLMTYDEAAEVHEELARMMRAFVPESPFLYYPWTIAGAIFVIIVAVVYLPFVRRLPSHVSKLFLLSGTIYVLGAIGVETIGSWAIVTRGETLLYYQLSVVEESMEMLGMAIFGFALLIMLEDSERFKLR
ncbi:MAG: hypothetical protein AAGA06_10865, partial [Pseudomonadota bacterium]